MSFRYGLQTYLSNPNQPLVLFYDDRFVIMKDRYPKALRHYLVLPRSKPLTFKHPVDGLADPTVYNQAEEYVEKAKDMIIEDLVKEGFIEEDPCVKETFKNTFIRAGIHKVPSMANLHIHVITQDFHLDRMKNKRHYNSFTTPFFVEFSDLKPSSENYLGSGTDSESDSDGLMEELIQGLLMRRPKKAQKLRPSRKFDYEDSELLLKSSPLVCAYCGKNLGNQFKALKQHLDREFCKKFSIPG